MFLGFDLKLKRTASRLQLMAALLFGMILYASMNALLVSKLANFEINMPFATLEDIATKRSHSLCVRTNSFVYSNFTVCVALKKFAQCNFLLFKACKWFVINKMGRYC